jgi:glycosyltransferase involved in cell wall biosynthesis
MLERIHKMKNIKLHGPYNEQNELAAIYAKGHVVFGMLDTLADENEGLLLPKRIYHAQAFGRPVVTTSGSVCADKVAIDNLGWAIESSVDSLCDFVLTLSKDGYSFYTEKMANLPAHTEAFLGKEYADLAKKL